MANKHDTDYIDVPATYSRFDAFQSGDYYEDTVQDRGELYSVDFNSDGMKGHASRANPWIALLLTPTIMAVTPMFRLTCLYLMPLKRLMLGGFFSGMSVDRQWPQSDSTNQPISASTSMMQNVNSQRLP
jgi:hypothetical protein